VREGEVDYNDFNALAEIPARGAQDWSNWVSEVERMERASSDFGFTFNSALEDAIINGKELGDVVKALGQDIARMVLRKNITEPLGNFVSGIDFGAIFRPEVANSGMDFGMRAEGGPVSAGRPTCL
jgi:hypothetical protein